MPRRSASRKGFVGSRSPLRRVWVRPLLQVVEAQHGARHLLLCADNLIGLQDHLTADIAQFVVHTVEASPRLQSERANLTSQLANLTVQPLHVIVGQLDLLGQPVDRIRDPVDPGLGKVDQPCAGGGTHGPILTHGAEHGHSAASASSVSSAVAIMAFATTPD